MRIAAIRYINALPLIFGLQKNPQQDLILDTPSSCYKRLLAGEVDVALIPVFGTQLNPNIRAIRGLGIAAFTQTESVFVYYKKPLERIETVAIDPASLTSVNLLKIILQMRYKNQPRFVTSEDFHLHERLEACDAALVIGDEAIMTSMTACNHVDLATEWYDLTALPFVFAVWASLQPISLSDQEIFRESLVAAITQPDQVIEIARKMLPVESEFLKRYYNLDLHYQLTPNDYQGLSQYLALAAEMKLIDTVRTDIWM